MKRFAGLLIVVAIYGQQPDQQGTYRVGDGVTSPTPTKKPDPKYTRIAHDYCVQGDIILRLVVGKDGKAGRITVISPLGFDLDEEAVKTVERWRFKPGNLNGTPVPILANVEVSFRLLGKDGGPPECGQRKVEQAIADLQVAAKADAARAELLEFKEKKFPAAQFLVGLWMIEGNSLPQNKVEGLALVRTAAAAKYGPALYYLGERLVTGKDGAPEGDKGWAMVTEAARYGSVQAQFSMGDRFENGTGGVAMDAARAVPYFWMCAKRGIEQCQFHVGRLLTFDLSLRPYAIAWLEIAAERGVGEAREWLAKEAPLTPEREIETARRLKPRLVARY